MSNANDQIEKNRISAIEDPYEQGTAWAVFYADAVATIIAQAPKSLNEFKSTLNDKAAQKALDLAKQSYGNDAFLFEIQPLFVEVALQAGDDEFALEVAEWHNLMLQMHGDEDGEEHIKQVLLSSPHVAKFDNFFMDLAIQESLDKLLADDITLAEHFNLIRDCQLKGFDPKIADIYRSSSYFFTENYDELRAFWQQRDIHHISLPRSFARVVTLKVIGYELPENNNPTVWYNALTEIYGFMKPLIDEWHDEPSDELQVQIETLCHLIDKMAKVAIDYFMRFENGERNGYANAPHFYAMLCRNYSLTLEQMAEMYDDKSYYEQAMILYKRGLALSPFLENAQGLHYVAIQAGNVATWQWADAYIQENFGHYLSFEDSFRLERFALWCKGLAGDLADFWQYYDAFWKKYRDFVRIGRAGNHRDYRFHNQIEALKAVSDDFNVATNNCRSGLKLLIEKYPNRLDILGAYIHHQRYVAYRHQTAWAWEIRDKIALFAKPQNSTERKWAFRAYSGLGYLIARMVVYDQDDHVKEGVDLMLLANQFAEWEDEPLYLADHYMALGRFLYIDLNDIERGREFLQKSVDIAPKSAEFSADILVDLAQADTLSSDELPDPVLGLAYYYLGYTKQNLKYPEAEFVNDRLKSYRLLSTIDDVWIELAHYLSGDETTQSDTLKFANLYLAAYDDDDLGDADDDTREKIGDMLSLKLGMLILAQRKDEAKAIFPHFEQYFSQHELYNTPLTSL